MIVRSAIPYPIGAVIDGRFSFSQAQERVPFRALVLRAATMPEWVSFRESKGWTTEPIFGDKPFEFVYEVSTD